MLFMEMVSSEKNSHEELKEKVERQVNDQLREVLYSLVNGSFKVSETPTTNLQKETLDHALNNGAADYEKGVLEKIFKPAYWNLCVNGGFIESTFSNGEIVHKRKCDPSWKHKEALVQNILNNYETTLRYRLLGVKTKPEYNKALEDKMNNIY